MKMKLTIRQISTELLEMMDRELQRYLKCTIQSVDGETQVLCESNDLVKCMEVVAVVDRYNPDIIEPAQQAISP
jgi:hypothetical protein